MTIGNIEIKDSLNFMSLSLDKLLKNLKEKGKKENKILEKTFPHTFEYFKSMFPNVDEDGFEILTRKGVYPYEYMDTEIDKFYSKLNGDFNFVHKL